ncbi:ABC transporter substrate-binding protein [Gluconacetobacter tumulisoli]|uniref:ABC transporter substrate-binding protein n=1 Tax=Gluconacetobacter tumulisoli TaxID=1286189 RepID=A0A7W4KA01_9PROT|nr:ABC transporter substrate-binding protein [Gluconacetobacter tumulisoli]MBB2203040.1 ABC transporter substrate-binding protein [Gluconacetobacter tumulisoli]
MLCADRRDLLLAGLAGAGLAVGRLRPGRAAAPIDREKVLVVAIGSDPVGLEPAANRAEPIGSEIIVNIFDPLVSWARDSDAEPQGRLAESWRVGDDGRRYSFTLREGLTFHDDTPCDAEAVRFSLERTRRLNPYMRASLDAVERFEVTGRLTLDIVLLRPVPFFLSLLAQPQSGIVSPTAVRRLGPDFASHPVGTGAFRLQSYTPDVGLTLVRNPSYFRGPSTLEFLVYRVIADASTRRLELERGEIDICQQHAQLTSLPMADIDSFRRNPEIQVIEISSQIMRQLEFNNRATGGPVTDLRVRKAIAHAVDYDGLVDGVLAGTVDRAYGPLPTTNWAFDPAMRSLAPHYDPQQSRALLAAAGYAPGALQISLYTFEGTFWAAVATFLQASLAAVGIDARIEQMEFPSLRALHVAGRFEAALDGREPWYNDPDAHITIGYLSGLAETAMTFRMPPDTALDGLILQAQTEIDPTRRKTLYGQIQARLMARVPAVYLFTNKVIVFARKEVQGLVVKSTPPLNEYWSVSKTRAYP